VHQYEKSTPSVGGNDRAYDGFIFVTPEINHAPPSALKNALDFIYPSGTTGPALSATARWRC
jgi:NAD(P)H-dependent FMN reductase